MVMTSDETRMQMFADWSTSNAKRVTAVHSYNSWFSAETHVVVALSFLRSNQRRFIVILYKNTI